jgi:uncharacterized protein (TIGR02246 family)
MKKTILLVMLTLVFIACQQEKKPAPVDLNAAETEVAALLDKFNAALMAKDAEAVASLLADEGLFLGTDPKEFWNRTEYIDMIKQVFADPNFTLSYTIDRTEIRVAPDGKTSVTIEQMFINFISQKIPIRAIMHQIKTDTGWKIDFYGSGLIPLNEDMPKINQALTE